MSGAEAASLLGWVRTPILVGDPDGCIVYANSAFRGSFCASDEDPIGRPLAMVFGGGAREAVLSATASVLQRGQTARLKLREAGRSFAGLASPIEAEDDRVGVIMVLLEEASNEEHLTGLADEVGAPLTEAVESLQVLVGSLDETLRPEPRELLDRALRAAEDAQRWLRELQLSLRSGRTRPGRFDVGAAIMRVADRARQELGPGLVLDLLVPPNLPRVAGTAAVFERVLTQLIRSRSEEARPGEPLTLLARALSDEPRQGVLVSLVDLPEASKRSGGGRPPESVQQGIAVMGGESVCVEDSLIGRVTGLRLEPARG